jgi:hypothetical protein
MVRRMGGVSLRKQKVEGPFLWVMKPISIWNVVVVMWGKTVWHYRHTHISTCKNWWKLNKMCSLANSIVSLSASWL